MATGAIEFEFKGNLAQLRRDLNEATSLARQSSAQTSRVMQGGFEQGFTGLFRRSPERRAELAFHQLAQNLSTGDVGMALASFSGRLSGLGLAAGIGVGVAVGFFQKFSQEIKEANKAAAALHEQLAKPISVIGGLGPGELTKQIDDLTKAGEENAEKQKSIASVLFGGAWRAIPGAGVKEEHEKEAKDFAERQAKISELRATAELKIANLKLQAVTSSEKDAALAKIAAEAEEKRAKLELERPAGEDRQKSIEAVNIEEKAARTEIEKKFKLKEDEAKLEATILGIKASQLDKDQKDLAVVDAKIKALQAEAKTATKDEKQGLQNKIEALRQSLPSPKQRKSMDPYDLSNGRDPYDSSGATDRYDLSNGRDPYDLSGNNDGENEGTQHLQEINANIKSLNDWVQKNLAAT